jgi:hypothetical protein
MGGLLLAGLGSVFELSLHMLISPCCVAASRRASVSFWIAALPSDAGADGADDAMYHFLKIITSMGSPNLCFRVKGAAWLGFSQYLLLLMQVFERWLS